jgi:hypothetical protein
MGEQFRPELSYPRSHTPLIFTGVSTQWPKDAGEKFLQKCDSVCDIFSVEHFVTVAEAVSAAAVIDDSNRGNAQSCISPN